MGYDVHIVRVDQKTKRRIPIQLDEWLSYIRSDGEMSLKGTAVAMSPRVEVIRMDAPGLTEWTHSSTGTRTWFDHRGRSNKISVKNPSRETLIKMFQVAEALDAIV